MFLNSVQMDLISWTNNSSPKIYHHRGCIQVYTRGRHLATDDHCSTAKSPRFFYSTKEVAAAHLQEFLPSRYRISPQLVLAASRTLNGVTGKSVKTTPPFEPYPSGQPVGREVCECVYLWCMRVMYVQCVYTMVYQGIVIIELVRGLTNLKEKALGENEVLVPKQSWPLTQKCLSHNIIIFEKMCRTWPRSQPTLPAFNVAIFNWVLAYVVEKITWLLKKAHHLNS